MQNPRDQQCLKEEEHTYARIVHRAPETTRPARTRPARTFLLRSCFQERARAKVHQSKDRISWNVSLCTLLSLASSTRLLVIDYIYCIPPTKVSSHHRTQTTHLSEILVGPVRFEAEQPGLFVPLKKKRIVLFCSTNLTLRCLIKKKSTSR